ncbi:MAG: hypothetical protein K2Z81_02400 [Cyanobacteria bacterium]|nr:hypothetical protein [Cyanobacteriota bacterium]
MSGQVHYADEERQAGSSPYILDGGGNSVHTANNEKRTSGDRSGSPQANVESTGRDQSSDMLYQLPELELVETPEPVGTRIPPEVRTFAQMLRAERNKLDQSETTSLVQPSSPQKDLQEVVEANAPADIAGESILAPIEPELVLSEPSVQELECALSGLNKILCDAGEQNAISLSLASKLLHGNLSGMQDVMNLIGQAPEALSAVVESISSTLEKYEVYTHVAYSHALDRAGFSMRGTLSLSSPHAGYISLSTNGGAIANSRVETTIEQDNSINILVQQDAPELVLSQIANRLVRAVNASWHS